MLKRIKSPRKTVKNRAYFLDPTPVSRTSFPLVKEDRIFLKKEIAEAGGVEVLSVAALGENGEWCDLRVLARGTLNEAPAILRGLRPGEILLHNHPEGPLTPSEADLAVASLCGRSGIGFAIHDNACRRAFVVVEPFPPEERVLLEKRPLLDTIRSKGPLAAKLPGFEERPGQIGLMEAVIKALNKPCHAVLEGETGVGKSLAYLLPVVKYVLANRCRAVISTNTINLQIQLCSKDIPLLKEALGLEFNHCLVKGRGNYLCLKRLSEFEHAYDGEWLLEAAEVDDFQRLSEWAKKTSDGSLSDLTWVPVDSLWEKIHSEKDTCLGLKCSEYRSCFFYRARRLSSEADILVANHHLLFSDLALRAETGDYSQTGILPSYKVAVLDEAHNLEEIATNHFGWRGSGVGYQKILGRLFHRHGRQEGGVLARLASRILVSGFFPSRIRDSLVSEIHGKIVPARQEAADLSRLLFDAITMFTVGENPKRPGEHRLRIAQPQREGDAFRDIAATGLKLRDALQDLKRVIQHLHRHLSDALENTEEKDHPFDVPLTELQGFGNRIAEMRSALTMSFEDEVEDRDRFVHFFTVNVRGNQRYSSLNAAPIEVAEPMRKNCFSKIPCVIMVSGTLSTRHDFSFIKNRLGLDSPEIHPAPEEGKFPSPFDYSRQSRLFLPDDFPEPGHPDFIRSVTDPVFQIAASSGGGLLVLCTSYMHLQSLHEALFDKFRDAGLECLKQGDMERHTLLQRFREDGNAVLLATDSFWEGVDVPGRALRNLILCKLPFAIPDDPVLSARQELLQKQGKNPFVEYQLPMAAIKLKQGFGRLIRHKGDRGTAWILDKRITTKFYGKFFLESLPAAQVFKGHFSDLLPDALGFFGRNIRGEICRLPTR